MSPLTLSAQSKPQLQPGKAGVPSVLVEMLKQEIADSDSADRCESSLARNFEIKAIDLNRDSIPEYVVHGRGMCFCSATGNCWFSIYHRTKGLLEPLLETDGVQLFKFANSVSNGYRDLFTWIHGSAFDSERRLFRFDGSRYQLMACWEESYSYLDTQGKEHILKQPRITPLACGPDQE